MDWSSQRVLITGAGGFLGAALARRLTDLGAQVIGLDCVSDSPCWRVVSGHDEVLVRADVCSDPDMISALKTAQPQAVFHLAGFSHILPAQLHPAIAWNLNVRGTWTVLEACRWYRDDGGNLQAVVISSSNHIYGSREQAWSEGDLPMPADVYGGSKYCADVIAQVYARSFGLPVIPLRHVNVYGPGDPHASHLVTACILAGLRGEPFVIKGRGRARKGYLYLDDALAAYQRCAELAADGWPWSWNAGAPPISVLDLAALVAQVTEGPAPVVIPQDETHAAQREYTETLDDAQLRRHGWAPQVRLEEGLRLTATWYREHGGMAWLS